MMACGNLRTELDQLAAGIGQNLPADRGMGADHRHLVVGQAAGLEQDVVGNGDLADVVQRGGEIDVAAEPGGEAELLGDDPAVAGDPQRVLAGIVVAVFDRERASDDGAHAIRKLQAAQLRDAQREFGGDIGQIIRALTAILNDASGVVGHGRSLFGGENGSSSSFLTRIKQTLAQASILIGTCESAGRSVDEALAVVEDTLAKFRQAIAGLAEASVDITLIGMNAGLKASHLGSRGSAFVVIANELKATADQVSAGAGRLRPVLDGIERSANKLKELRIQGDPTQLANLEPQILQALREVEAGNERLGKLMSRLVDEGAEFEGLMNSAQGLMSSLGESSATLPTVAARLETASAGTHRPLPQDAALLDDLFARYTMERERDVHWEFLQALGPSSSAAARRVEAVAPEDDGIELF